VTVSDEELGAALERALGTGTARIERRTAKFRTSFPLEDVDVTLEDGTMLALVLKVLSAAELPEKAREAKPEFLLDPERELEAYRDLLPDDSLGTPRCYAAVSEGERHWLLLERVNGIPLWQVGELETWQAAARWLAALHERFAAEDGWRAQARHLLRYDAALYRQWARRAREHAAAAGRRRRERERVVDVTRRFETVIDRLAALPTTFIHGEFYASNVVVDGARIAPIDWELAAQGPGLIDLAALSTGRWGDSERQAIASAYERALTTPPGYDFGVMLDSCRLHLAVQWLGWAPGWRPPRAHRYDWLSEATDLVERLGL
jgi:aminoglycoside phosphotransferase